MSVHGGGGAAGDQERGDVDRCRGDVLVLRGGVGDGLVHAVGRSEGLHEVLGATHGSCHVPGKERKCEKSGLLVM